MNTDGNAKAKRALKKIKTTAKEEPVIVVEIPNKTGEIEKLSAELADAGIDIQYTYRTSGSKRSAFCVVKTDNDAKAVRVINRQIPWQSEKQRH